MLNQPMQLDKKDFQELLKEIQKYNKIDFVAQALQTKYASETAGEDDEEAKKARKENNNLLEKIYEAILKGSDRTNKVADKVEKLSSSLKSFKPTSDIRDDRPVTIKEGLKSLVAGTKTVGSKIKSAVSGTLNALSSPVESFKNLGGGLEGGVNSTLKTASDILSTPEQYSVEGGRFAEAYSRTVEGTRFQKGGKGSLDVGLEKFNELKAKEEKIKKVQQKIDEQKKYGFEPNKGDVEELERLKKQYSKSDFRNKEAQVEKKIDQPKTEMAKIERKLSTKEMYVQASVTDEQKLNWGEFAATRHAEKQYDKNVENWGEFAASKNAEKLYEEKFPSAKQKIEAYGKAENPNIVDEANEIVAEETKKQSVTFKELLDITKESLNQLRTISGSLQGASASKATPTTTPSAAALAAEAGGGSVIGDVAGAAASGIGGKVLGGLKAGGAMLGKGALAAGKFIGGAALAKPALIAAGVGLAAYGAYKGYKALTKKDDETTPGAAADPFIEKAKSSKQAQALQKLNEEGKYTFNAEGRNVNVFDKESGELLKSIEAPNGIKGAELLQAVGIGGGTAVTSKPEAKANTDGAAPITSTKGDQLAAAKKPPEQVTKQSLENAAIKDEMAASGKSTTPVVMNNVSNNSQTTYVPIKGEPRPGSRGSALDRYNDRVATY